MMEYLPLGPFFRAVFLYLLSDFRGPLTSYLFPNQSCYAFLRVAPAKGRVPTTHVFPYTSGLK